MSKPLEALNPLNLLKPAQNLKVPDIPPPPIPAPPKPGVDEADTKARMAAAEQNAIARKKKTGTILTSAQGVLDQAPVQIKQLFGN